MTMISTCFLSSPPLHRPCPLCCFLLLLPLTPPLSHTPPNPLILQLVVRLHCRSTRSGDKWANLLQTSAGERVLYCEQSKSWFDPLKSKTQSWFKTHGRFLQNEMCQVLICCWCDVLLTWRIVQKFLCATSYLFSFLFKKQKRCLIERISMYCWFLFVQMHSHLNDAPTVVCWLRIRFCFLFFFFF